MTNAQNIEATIEKLMEEERKLKEAYKEAEDWNTESYNRVLVWEEAYAVSGENEKVGQILDEVYEEYEKANSNMREAEEGLEAMEEALQGLRKAMKIVELLGL